jgi:pyochelin biosynthetic protein PchC
MGANMNNYLHSRQHRRWFEYFNSDTDADATLFCFPFVGGNEHNYAKWSDKISSHYDIAALKIPGRPSRSREGFPEQMADLVTPIVEQLVNYPKPFAIFGHSMGGLLAFLVTAALNQKEIKTLGTFISARPAPQLSVLKRRAHLPEPALINELRILGGTPEEVLQDTQLMQSVLPIIRADYHLLEQFTYGDEANDITQPLEIIAAKQDKLVSDTQINAWHQLPLKQVNQFDIAGEHFYLNQHPQALFEYINTRLNNALPKINQYAFAS